MFSALRQGSTLYILEKGEKPILKTGQVIGVTFPNNNFLTNTVNITIKVGEATRELTDVPSSLSVAQQRDLIIAETKDLMSNEVDNLVQSSRSVIESVPYHQSIMESCEEILKGLNPRFAKEKERDEDINGLKKEMGEMGSKMDKILTLLETLNN